MGNLGEKTLLIGVITPFVTGRGPPCKKTNVPSLKLIAKAPEKWSWKMVGKGNDPFLLGRLILRGYVYVYVSYNYRKGTYSHWSCLFENEQQGKKQFLKQSIQMSQKSNIKSNQDKNTCSCYKKSSHFLFLNKLVNISWCWRATTPNK